jgi:preprotein translocase subunit SecA
MFGLLKKIFGTAQSRAIKRFQKMVKEVNRQDLFLMNLTDESLRAKTDEFKNRLKQGQTLEQILPEAYAVVKNVCRRLTGQQTHVSGYDQKWDMVPYDTQVLAGIAMHYGNIAEMQTGEGKTLTASMPLYLNALTEKPVHIVTVNDYLAKRDSEWIGEIFRWLGLSVGALTSEVSPTRRKALYKSDILYGTASEFGFDYLRDNSMAQSAHEQVQRGQYFALIDEVDSILIDEARTPLIISGPAPQTDSFFAEINSDIQHLVRLQKDTCHDRASLARKKLEELGLLEESADFAKKLKEHQKETTEILKSLWLVTKGMPHNKILRRLKENPDLRVELDKIDTYFYAEPNKEEKIKALSELYIIVDERASDFELTDKGIQAWTRDDNHRSQDFVMLDLGYEYGQIDQDSSLDEEQKLEAKLKIREEDNRRKERSHSIRQLFRAHLLMEKDVDYMVQEGKIVIIDENTGRAQPGRRFSDGLHQAIEAKEGVEIQGETQTYATVTLQNYFRRYQKLAGMTGTAMTEAQEFKEIYKIDVLAIPTHRNCSRKDFDDEIYMTEREKYQAILKDIQTVHATGRPILIGTESVDISEKISRILKQMKLEHTVLNAKHNATEAQVIADAGKPFAITVSTNMAGRGTDIKLQADTAEKGGLHVIGTTRHHSRRIDRQLRGRSGRQGDPGSSKFYVSFDDSLMRLFTSPKVSMLLQRFRPPEGEPISAKMLNRSIETAQKRIEQRHYTVRKHTLEYDDVMNKQREEVYRFRNDVLHSAHMRELASELIEHLSQDYLHMYLEKDSSKSRPSLLCDIIVNRLPINFHPEDFRGLAEAEIYKKIVSRIKEVFDLKLEHQLEKIRKSTHSFKLFQVEPEKLIEEVMRNIFLRRIDKLWQNHLGAIDHLRTEVNLRTIGQKDPLIEFKQEAFDRFGKLSLNLKEEILEALFKFEIAAPEQEQEVIEEEPTRFQTNLSLLD